MNLLLFLKILMEIEILLIAYTTDIIFKKVGENKKNKPLKLFDIKIQKGEIRQKNVFFS